MDIPLFDLRPTAEELRQPLLRRWDELLCATAFVGGREVARFEEDYAAMVGATGCVGVANGTDALVVALRALEVGPGDDVLVPAFTFFATAEAVALVGARPVFLDVDEATLNLDSEEIERRRTERTVGVVGVHLFGQPFDVAAVRSCCDSHGLWLVEDAAQAHGARWQGEGVGTFGRLAGWSFYPSKNLGCFGDGGAITGSDPELLARVRMIANHGRVEHYLHGVVGMNSRLDGLQAAVLNLRLPLLPAENARRRQIATRYREALGGVGDLRFVTVPDDCVPVYHQVTVRTARRDALRQRLGERGIGSAVFYPRPLHLLAAMEPFQPEVPDLPVATRAAEEVLSLPLYPALGDEAVDRVCDEVRAFFS